MWLHSFRFFFFFVKGISLSTPGENISDFMLKGQGLGRSWVMLYVYESPHKDTSAKVCEHMHVCVWRLHTQT